MTEGRRFDELLTDLFSVRLHDAEPVIQLLDFNSNDWDSEDDDLQADLFKIKFARYLRGRGHPNHPSIVGALISEEEYERLAENTAYRAERFLSIVTGSELLHVRDPFAPRISVSQIPVRLGA